MSILKEAVVVWIKKFSLIILAVACMGFGIAFNALACLGNDPISVLYDGIKNFFHMDLGTASMVINFVLLIIIFVFEKKFINVGTITYVITLGLFINWGMVVYKNFSFQETMPVKIFTAFVGCFLLFLGIAIFIFVNLGLDTWSGVTVLLSEKLHISYKIVKISMDVVSCVIGVMLGGVMGVVTVFAALLGGPLIEILKKLLDKTLSTWVTIK